jgi:hypothetical protein
VRRLREAIWRKGRFLENTKSFTSRELFCLSPYHPRLRRDEAVRRYEKKMTFSLGRENRLRVASSFVLAEYRSRYPPLMAFSKCPRFPIRELHIVPCRLITGYISNPVDRATLGKVCNLFRSYPICGVFEEPPRSSIHKPSFVHPEGDDNLQR